MNHLLITYWVCTGLGFLYIVGGAVLGHLDGAEDMDGEGADPGDVDAGDPGDVDADGGDPGDVDGAEHHGSRPVIFEHTAAGTIQKTRFVRNETLFLKVLGLFSPTKISMFLFFFGAFGIVFLNLMPQLGFLTLLPAIVLGYGFGRILLNLFSAFVSRLHSSTNFKQESLIGEQAVLTLSIEPGSLGEVMVAKRGASPARAKDPSIAIKNRSKVIICDRKDGVFIVEPLKDEEFS